MFILYTLNSIVAPRGRAKVIITTVWHLPGSQILRAESLSANVLHSIVWDV